MTTVTPQTFNSSPYESTLREGATSLGLSLSDTQIAQLLGYHALIQKWNKVYNLTAIREPGEMLTHHLLDSLAVVAPLRIRLAGLAYERDGTGDTPVSDKYLYRLLDVGSGAGLPGLLSNLNALHARVESLTDKYDIISSRAFATLLDFVTGSRAALRPVTGVWLAMKAKDTSVEVAALPADVEVFHVEQLTVPGLDAERCIVWMRGR